MCGMDCIVSIKNTTELFIYLFHVIMPLTSILKAIYFSSSHRIKMYISYKKYTNL